MGLLILVVLAFAFGVAIVVGGYLGATRVPGMRLERKLESRLKEISQAPEELVGGQRELLKEPESGPLPALDRILRGTTQGSALSRWLEQTGTKTTVSALLLMALASAV